MRVDYSKPLGDIQLESDKRTAEAAELAARQRETVKFLAGCPPRERCTNCGAPLNGDRFLHRNLAFIRCATCGHILSEAQPPADYPQCVPGGTSFAEIYPELDDAAYEDRKRRIYRPKLDWLLGCLDELPIPVGDYRQLQWLELGSGAGYFLSSLVDAGVARCQGIESNAKVAGVAQRRVPNARTIVSGDTLDVALDRYRFDIYIAFFVLEHVHDLVTVWHSIRKLPVGTVFVFSVPVFGFSCLLEQVFSDCYARNLDGVVHTQLFTDASVEYAMQAAGLGVAAEWVFGQDAQDLSRMALAAVAKAQPPALVAEWKRKFGGAQDSIQQALDHNRLSDQRHIVGQRV